MPMLVAATPATDRQRAPCLPTHSGAKLRPPQHLSASNQTAQEALAKTLSGSQGCVAVLVPGLEPMPLSVWLRESKNH